MAFPLSSGYFSITPYDSIHKVPTYKMSYMRYLPSNDAQTADHYQ